MILQEKIDKKYSIWICYELGIFNYRLRKAFINNNTDEFQEIYLKCINNAINKYNPEILDIYKYYSKYISILEKRIYTPLNINTIVLNDTILTIFEELNLQPLGYIIETTFLNIYTIVDSYNGSFIII